jgi:hypothetical protein
MPDYKALRLIAIYVYISELYKIELQYTCQRFSNNSSPDFTDQELMTIYLFVVTEQQYFQVKQIHRFAGCISNCRKKNIILTSSIFSQENLLLFVKYK